MESALEGMESGAPGMESAPSGMESGLEGMESGAAGMECGLDGMQSGVAGMESAASRTACSARQSKQTYDSLSSARDPLAPAEPNGTPP